MPDDTHQEPPQGDAVQPAKKQPMTEAEFFARADALVAEARESGLDYVGLLLAKYGLRKGSNFLEAMFDYGFSKSRGK